MQSVTSHLAQSSLASPPELQNLDTTSVRKKQRVLERVWPTSIHTSLDEQSCGLKTAGAGTKGKDIQVTKTKKDPIVVDERGTARCCGLLPPA